MNCIPGAVICALIKAGAVGAGPSMVAWINPVEIVLMYPATIDGREMCQVELTGGRNILASNPCDELAARIGRNE